MTSIAKLLRIAALAVPFVSQFGVRVTAGQAPEPETFFHNFVGLSDDQIRDIRAGKAIAKVLDTPTPDDSSLQRALAAYNKDWRAQPTKAS